MSDTPRATVPAPPAGGGRIETFELPLAAGISALFFAVFLALPVAGALGYPLAAVPLVRVAHRRGLWSALLAAALSAAVLFGLAAASSGWRGAAAIAATAAFLSGLPALFAGQARRGVGPSRAYLGLAISGGLLLVGLLVGLPAAGEPPLSAELKSAFDAMIPSAIDSYRRGGADAASLERVRTTLLAAQDFTVRYWAGLAGACWVLGSGIAFYLGARAARPAPSAVEARFETLRIPAPFAAVFVAAGAAFALAGASARTAAGDILIALAALYFVGGLSIICHFARRWFRAWFLRLGLYILIAYFPMNVGVALLGLFDWYANFRRRGEKGHSASS
ncbi:MAG TPA: DUF2232 domain-containing protein [Thermoanaerobaculia bacterium]